MIRKGTGKSVDMTKSTICTWWDCTPVKVQSCRLLEKLNWFIYAEIQNQNIFPWKAEEKRGENVNKSGWNSNYRVMQVCIKARERKEKINQMQ